MSNRVPFLDLRDHHEPNRAEFERAIREVIDSSAFAGGPFVEKFENEFAAYCGSKYCVAVGSGTDALWLSLLGLGVGEGDEVITVPNSFMATAEAISRCGARPVFVDVEETTYNMDPARVEAAITPRTRAIIPVHLFGHPADLDPILKIAQHHGLLVIEDAAQAHGAKYKEKSAGTIGDAGCFSFYPGKNLGAFGEAGAIVTNNEELQQKMRTLRDHGQVRKYVHTLVGWNCRMDGIQAAVLSVKLKHLEDNNSLRRKHAQRYDERLTHVEGISTPFRASYANPVYHIYAIRTTDRDEVLFAMRQKGVECGIHYPRPIHLQKAYAELGYSLGSFPVAERIADELISLPMFPELREVEIDVVVAALREAVLNKASTLKASGSLIRAN